LIRPSLKYLWMLFTDMIPIRGGCCFHTANAIRVWIPKAINLWQCYTCFFNDTETIAFCNSPLNQNRKGVTLVRYKGKRIFLDELPVNARGYPMKDMYFECGIFCGGNGAGVGIIE